MPHSLGRYRTAFRRAGRAVDVNLPPSQPSGSLHEHCRFCCGPDRCWQCTTITALDNRARSATHDSVETRRTAPAWKELMWIIIWQAFSCIVIALLPLLSPLLSP